jgi:thiamine biosynthesis lipoprotein
MTMGLLIALFFAAAPEAAPAAVERRVALMGTTADVAIVATDREAGLTASETVVEELSRVEALLTTWRPGGPLARLDVATPGEEQPLDAELFAVLSEVFAWSERTGGAFDPTVAPLVRAWGLRGAGRIPSSAELAAARHATGTSRFRLDASRATAVRLDADAGIDEGAWGKGYALDCVAKKLDAAGVGNALVDLGGQVLALGARTGGEPWTITIAHPTDRQRPVVTLAVADVSVSTSGDSERRRVVHGRSIGHLLDPHTGEPAPDFGSATVVAPSALTADVLSTAFFVLGPEKGLALSERLRREGVPNEVFFLVDRGGALEAAASPGIFPLVVSTDSRAVHGLPITHH